MTLSARSPRDGTVIATALLLGPLIGTGLITVPWLLFAVFRLASEGFGSEHFGLGWVAEAAASLASFGVLAPLFGFALGAIPAILSGMIYAALRRALGERTDVAALSALMVAMPIGVWFGVSGSGLVGFCLVVGHIITSAALTWAAATALRRRRFA